MRVCTCVCMLMFVCVCVWPCIKVNKTSICAQEVEEKSV